MLFLTFISWCAVRQSRPLRSDLVTSCTLTHFVGFEVFCWGSRSLALCGFLCFTLMLFYVILFIFSVQRDTNSSKWQKTKFKITRNMPKDHRPTHVSEHSFFLQGFPAQAATSQLAGSPAERCHGELPVVARWESLQRCFRDSEQLEPEAGSWPGPWPGLVQEQPWWSGLSGRVLVAAQQHWAGGEPRLHVRWVTDCLKGEYAQINLDNDEQWFCFFFQTPLRSWLLPTKKPRLQISWSTRRFALRSVSQRSVSPSRWAASPKSRLLHLSTPTPAAVRRHLSPQVSRRVSDIRGLQRLVAACSDPVWISTFSFISLDFNAEWKTFDDFYLQKPPKTQNWHPRSPPQSSTSVRLTRVILLSVSGFTMKALLLLVFTVFIFTALYSGWDLSS